MRFPIPLVEARLLRRYKRFLADMEMPDGTQVTAHCPNPGAMTGLATPGQTCWLAPAAQTAKLDWGWKLTRTPEGAMAIIDTSLANRIVAEALTTQTLAPLGHTSFTPEAKLDATSRIDFRLTTLTGPLWLEVKSVTLARGTQALFPDSKTARGTKHLHALTQAVAQGEQAAMLYLISRDDTQTFDIAADIDPTYAAAFQAAKSAGVAIYTLTTQITPTQITAQTLTRLA